MRMQRDLRLSLTPQAFVKQKDRRVKPLKVWLRWEVGRSREGGSRSRTS
jgi:hypothetical protein